ncbi:hypothetical protein CIPAW_15G125900 [Carya illinoinensis]|uniref:Uncharacterized protein n=1 Tax=Carya illinoinensis TaxID=32201 RepID=A0A8T1NE71_CARIL|nr:hypothetical protein CIPAW_15G125900 [Carya illinoinensis]KAG6627414.1 hypothetical protein CIPAW_15G125900 [Carya illinoinensis]
MKQEQATYLTQQARDHPTSCYTRSSLVTRLLNGTHMISRTILLSWLVENKSVYPSYVVICTTIPLKPNLITLVIGETEPPISDEIFKSSHKLGCYKPGLFTKMSQIVNLAVPYKDLLLRAST